LWKELAGGGFLSINPTEYASGHKSLPYLSSS
jgi:hypothetical protein